MAAGSLTLGGNMSIALGPLGRNGEASGSLNTKGKVAAMFVSSITMSAQSVLTPPSGTATPKHEASSVASPSKDPSS